MAELLEEWWRALGVVPKARYDEVLRQNQKLRDHIAQAEKTIADLRKLLSREVAEQSRQQAEVVLKNWESTAQELLKAQADLAQQWSEGIFGKTPKGET
jgi:cell division septum initiation protein DivIVA